LVLDWHEEGCGFELEVWMGTGKPDLSGNRPMMQGEHCPQ
jgi:hypothetical protein